MKTLCDSCRRTWSHAEDVECELIKNAYAMQGKGVESCSRYYNMAIIETEDDGTERCGLCGKLHWGWENVCPVCGTDYGR